MRKQVIHNYEIYFIVAALVNSGALKLKGNIVNFANASEVEKSFKQLDKINYLIIRVIKRLTNRHYVLITDIEKNIKIEIDSFSNYNQIANRYNYCKAYLKLCEEDLIRRGKRKK